MDVQSRLRAVARPGFHKRIVPYSIFAFLLLAANARAFHSSLQPEEVQNAYSLGQSSNHEEVTDFLDLYEHHFNFPSDDSIAFAQSVEFQTPYEQIVLRSLRTPGYSKFKAAEDYAADPRRIVVRVVVSLKNGYSGPIPPANSYKVIASQIHSIKPINVETRVLCDPSLYSSTPTVADCIAYSSEIRLQFSARQFAPGTVKIKVVLPDGKSVQTTFDLDSLK